MAGKLSGKFNPLTKAEAMNAPLEQLYAIPLGYHATERMRVSVQSTLAYMVKSGAAPANKVGIFQKAEKIVAKDGVTAALPLLKDALGTAELRNTWFRFQDAYSYPTPYNPTPERNLRLAAEMARHKKKERSDDRNWRGHGQ